MTGPKHDAPRPMTKRDAEGNIVRLSPDYPHKPIRPERVNAPDAFPSDLLHVEGLLGHFVAECLRSAPERRQPVYALATAICVVGALAGRRYRSLTDLRTNIYAAILGQSSSGKNHSQRVASQLLIKANLAHYIAADYASGASIASELTEFPVRLAIVDEFGIWLSQLTGDRTPRHLVEIRKKLMTLFSTAADIVPGSGYADRKLRERKDICQPHLCFIGLGTPDNFFQALQSGALKDGFIPRFLVFRPDAYIPDLIAHPNTLAISDDMILAAQQIAGTSPESGNIANIVLMRSDATFDPHMVPYSTDGLAEHERYREIRETITQDGCLDFCSPELVGKWGEHAIKLGMIRAISRDPAAPVLDKVCVAWGWRVSEWCIQVVNSMAERHIADNQTEADNKRVRNIIADAGAAWITTAVLIQKTRFLQLKSRNDILASLVGSGEIEAEALPPGPKGGRPGARYRMALPG
jgi:hypothetical protein